MWVHSSVVWKQVFSVKGPQVADMAGLDHVEKGLLWFPADNPSPYKALESGPHAKYKVIK